MNPEIAKQHEDDAQEQLSRVRALREELSRQFPNGIEAGLAHYESWLRNEMTYTSNAIEGNTLSSAETNLVVNEGAVIPDKSLREHLEDVTTPSPGITSLMSLSQNVRSPLATCWICTTVCCTAPTRRMLGCSVVAVSVSLVPAPCSRTR